MATLPAESHHNGPLDPSVRLDRATVATFRAESHHNGPLDRVAARSEGVAPALAQVRVLPPKE